MKTKELEESFEKLTEDYKREMLPSYDKGGKDYEQTKEAHREFINGMKVAYFQLLSEYNIKVNPGGPYADQCNYVGKILESEDEKKIIQKQKELMYECARYAFDVTSDSRDENESDERDAKNRKIKPEQAVQQFKSEARTQLYTDASTFEFLANTFYNDNIDNLMFLLSARGFNQDTLDPIYSDLRAKCQQQALKDVDKYYDMILGDSNRSFSDLENKQEEMFINMDDLVLKKERENDPFGTLTPEERKEHEKNVRTAFEESKLKATEDKERSPFDDDFTLYDSFL